MQDTTTHSREQTMFSHIENWQHSGLRQKEYCLQNQIRPWAFQYWLRKYRKQQSAPKGFIPLQIPKGLNTDVRIHYPNGVQVHVPMDTGIETLRSLIHLGS